MIISILFGLLFVPCEFEDSTNCTWIAEEHGNSEGQSFTDIMGNTFYWGEK